MAQKAPTLYLIDGHAQLYRAYHAIRPGSMLAADRKTPTNAVFGFGSMLRSLRSRFKPDLLAAVFDPRGPVKREELYQQYADKLGPAFSGYKSQRDAMPDDLRPQVGLAIELCEAYGIPAIQMEGYEADDVLGTLARQAIAHNLHAVIVTGDKDLLQLVGGGIKVYDPMKDITYDEDNVLELKGIRPNQIIDWLGFMGDAADNIPGVSGVGGQTAVKLLQTHGNMDAVLDFYAKKFAGQSGEIIAFVKAHEEDALKEKEQRGGVKPPKGVKVVDAYLFAQQDRARASRELARLHTELPLTLDLDKLHCRPPEASKLAPLLNRLDFSSFKRDLDEAALLAYQTQTAKDEDQRSSDAGVAKTGVNYTLVDDEAKFEAFCRQLEKQTRFAIDTETTSTHPHTAKLVGISFSWSANEAFYIPVHGPLGEQKLDLQPVLTRLKPALENPRIGKIGHHIKYDLEVFHHHGVRLDGVVYDTMIAGWLLDPGALRLNLEYLSYHYLGRRKTETHELLGKGKDQITMDLVPIADVANYACQDADCTWQLAEKLGALLKDANLEPLMRDIEVPLIYVLADMEITGVRVDGDLLRKMSKSLETQLAAMETDIFEMAGERFNINSTRQLGALLFEKLGLTSKVKTSTGKNSTSEEVLTQLAKEHDLPRLILEFRGMQKLKNTYLDALPLMISAKTGRIHATFQQTGSETGRLSSNDPNLQNIPVRSELGRSIRAAFKPGFDGWKILGADYSQIELRILAHYSRDEMLLEAFRKGIDIHTAVASKLFQVGESEVTREQRSRAKAVNFGIIYGQSAFGLANLLSIPRHEAQRIIDTYFANHPGVRRCIDEIVAQATEQGFVTTVLGRRRFIPQLRASDRGAQGLGERLAVNTVFQGSAADLIKKAMIEIHAKLQNESWRSKMILQIHDELLFESPPDEVEKLAVMVKAKMEQALTLNVPLTVEYGIGDDWLSAKD
jgi:DNA polymerase-1